MVHLQVLMWQRGTRMQQRLLPIRRPLCPPWRHLLTLAPVQHRQRLSRDLYPQYLYAAAILEGHRPCPSSNISTDVESTWSAQAGDA